MADTWTSHQEIEQMREEIRSLHEEVRRAKQLAGGDAKRNGRSSDQESEDTGNQDGQIENKGQKTRHRRRNLILFAAGILVAVTALIWWLYSRHFEDTDDAQVDGHISGIAARISGTITGVYVEENQFVKAGEVVADLDPRDYQIAVEQARSQLHQAESATLAEQPNIPVTEVTNQTSIATTSADVTSASAGVAAAESDYQAALAKVRESEANNAKAQADVERYRPLAEKDEVPQEQFDGVVATAKAMAATVASDQASAAATRKQVDQKQADLLEAQRRLEQAQKNAPRQIAIRTANVNSRRSSAEAARAQLDQALLNLSYCKIVTPVTGIVAKRTAEVGQGVAPGQQVLLVTQTGDLWVTANFRETQLRRVRPGQGARIHVDALARDFDGYVESMPAATGAVTSLLPPENATGNFVKIVQRLPVRIRFKPGQQDLDRLRPGMSVEPKVRVQ